MASGGLLFGQRHGSAVEPRYECRRFEVPGVRGVNSSRGLQIAMRHSHQWFAAAHDFPKFAKRCTPTKRRELRKVGASAGGGVTVNLGRDISNLCGSRKRQMAGLDNTR